MSNRSKLDDNTIINLLEDRRNGLGILKASKKYKLGQSTIRKLENEYHVVDNNFDLESEEDNNEKITLQKIYDKLLVIENNTDTYDIFEELQKGEKHCDLISKYWSVFSMGIVGITFLYNVVYNGGLVSTIKKHVSTDKK